MQKKTLLFGLCILLLCKEMHHKVEFLFKITFFFYIVTVKNG